MNKIEKIAKLGWTITEIRFDKHQNFWYCGASHDSGEASAEGCGEGLSAAIEELYKDAKVKTPVWYVAQLTA